jgi:hypothetical protein
MPGGYALYRYFDSDCQLPYVGISGNLGVREIIHKSTSTWMQFAVRSTVERCEMTLAQVMKIERTANETERPLFNVKHNDTLEARQRLRAYLEAIGRPVQVRPKPEALIAEAAPRAPRPADRAILRETPTAVPACLEAGETAGDRGRVVSACICKTHARSPAVTHCRSA